MKALTSATQVEKGYDVCLLVVSGKRRLHVGVTIQDWAAKLGSSISIYGCYKYRNIVGEVAVDHVRDEERGTYVAPTVRENADISNTSKSFTDENSPYRKGAGVYVYIFQVIYQMCGGALVLIVVVFWLILYPILTSNDVKLDFMIVSCTHSILLSSSDLGEAILNNLVNRFLHPAVSIVPNLIFCAMDGNIRGVPMDNPNHACVNIWPYSFLDLSSSFAPLWYLGVEGMHIPCYGVFALVIRFQKSFLGER